MASGRLYKGKIAESRRWRLLYQIDRFVQSIYAIIIAKSSSYGILPADALRLKAAVGPFDPLPAERFAWAAGELHRVGLVHIFNHQGDPWLYVVGHEREQDLRKRGAAPDVPRPDVDEMERAADERFRVAWADYSGTTPGVVPESSGNEVEGKGSRREGERQKSKPASPATGIPPSQLKGPRITGEEHTEIQELQAAWARRWERNPPTSKPTGGNLQRALQALRSPRFGYDRCLDAVYGQHKLASKEGSQMGREFRHVFPSEPTPKGRNQYKLDEDRFDEFADAGHKLRPDPKAEEKRKAKEDAAQKQADAEAAETAARAGVSKVKSAKDLRKIMKQAQRDAREKK